MLSTANPIHIILNQSEESNTYFVNGNECARSDIYKTIVDNELYTGEITVELKHRVKSNDDGTKNLNANMSLNISAFAKKYKPDTNEFKQLIEKIIVAVDATCAAQDDYSQHGEELSTAMRDCMTFLLSKLTGNKSKYEDIISQAYAEILVFGSSNIAFSECEALKRCGTLTGHPQIPSQAPDISSFQETWNDELSDSKKFEYVTKYLSVILEQTDVMHKVWLNDDVVKQFAPKSVIDKRFADFKDIIKSLQKKLDKCHALGRPSIVSSLTTFLHIGHRTIPSVHKSATPDSSSAMKGPGKK